MANETVFPQGIILPEQSSNNNVLATDVNGVVYDTGISTAEISGADTPFVLDVYDGSGGQSFTSNTINLNLPNIRSNTAPLTVVGGNAVQANKDVSLFVAYRVSTDISSGTSRSCSSCWLALNGVEIAGTRAFMYNRIFGNASNTGTGHMFIDLTAGDQISIQATRTDGSDTIITLANGSGLTAFVIGGSGPQGDPGEKGEKGNPGGGSNVSISENGSSLGIADELDFIGVSVAVSGGTATIQPQVNSGTSFPVSPIDGQNFYKTDEQWHYTWDATRGKWLGEIEWDGAGYNGSVNGFLRRFNGMTMSATSGPIIPYNATIVGISFGCTNNVSGTIEVRRNGTIVSTIPISSSIQASSLTLNDFFAANGVFAVSTNLSSNAANPQVRVWFRRQG